MAPKLVDTQEHADRFQWRTEDVIPLDPGEGIVDDLADAVDDGGPSED